MSFVRMKSFFESLIISSKMLFTLAYNAVTVAAMNRHNDNNEPNAIVRAAWFEAFAVIGSD